MKLVVSTTSVLPSQCPTESPCHSADVLRDVRAAVGGDDARGVVRLVKQGHISAPLHNLQKVAFIGAGNHRNSLLVHQDAALTQRAVRVAVEFVSLAHRSACGVSFPGLRQHGRHDAFRPDDERGALRGGETDFGRVETVQLRGRNAQPADAAAPRSRFLDQRLPFAGPSGQSSANS